MSEFFQIRRNQIIVAIVGVLMVGLVLFLVFGRTQATPTVVGNPDVTLVWWKPFYGNDVYRDIINDFKSLPGNRNVKIDIVRKDYGDSYYNSLITDFARDAGPDIFSLRNDDLPAYKEFMTPIRSVYPSLPDSKLVADYQESFTDLVVRDTMDLDEIYAVTSYVDNLQLYYNEDIINQANFALPPGTWSDLDRQLSTLNQRDQFAETFNQSAISLGTGFRNTSNQFVSVNINRFQDILPMLVFQQGGQLYDYVDERAIFGSPEEGISAPISETPAFDALDFYQSFSNPSSSRYSSNIVFKKSIV